MIGYLLLSGLTISAAFSVPHAEQSAAPRLRYFLRSLHLPRPGLELLYRAGLDAAMGFAILILPVSLLGRRLVGARGTAHVAKKKQDPDNRLRVAEPAAGKAPEPLVVRVDRGSRRSLPPAWREIMIWLLIGYMWLFVHRPFEIWTVLATYRIEAIYMIFTIICWLLSGPHFPARNRLNLCFGSFVLAMLTSWFVSPYQEVGSPALENYLKCAVFYVILLSVVRNVRDLRTILVAYLAISALWMLHSLREFYFCGARVWAQGFERLEAVGHSYDFNDFAGLLVCSLPLAWIVWRQWPGRRAAPFGPRVFRPLRPLHYADRFADGVPRRTDGQCPGVPGLAQTLAAAGRLSGALCGRMGGCPGKSQGKIHHLAGRGPRNEIHGDARLPFFRV